MASERKIQMVTHQGDLVIFQCKRSISTGSEITSWRMSFKQEPGIFLKKDGNITLVYKTSREVKMVHCSTSINVKRRQRVPCVLLSLCRKGSSGFKYMLFSLNSSNSANLHVEFSLPYEIMDNVSILRGPTLVWTHKDVVFFTSPEAAGVTEIPVHLKVNFIGEVPLRQRQLGILGSQMVSQEDRLKNYGKCRTLLFLIEDSRTFSGCCFFPDPYSSIIRCLVVLSAMEMDGSLRSSVVAATSRKQLVCFENGLLDSMCVLPYEAPQNIQIARTGIGCLIVIIFDHGNVCAVRKDTFEMVACWTDVRLLLMDDFVGDGFEQMLLLFEEHSLADEILGKFLLTDLCGIYYSPGKAEHGKECKTAEENVILTIQALDARLQNGLVFLRDMQQDMHVKDCVIQQCMSALLCLLTKRKHLVSPPQQEQLVCLLDDQSEEDRCTLEKWITADSQKQLSRIERVWHRVINKDLVLGMFLTPSSQITEVEKIITAVLGSSAVSQSRAQIIYNPDPVNLMMFRPPSAKRIRYSPGPVVLIVTDLASLLNFNPRSYSILLYFPHSATETASHSELVNLDIEGLLEGKFEQHLKYCSIDYEDLLSLMTTVKPWCFWIRCTDHSVVDVAMFLEEKLGAERVKVNPQYLVSRSKQTSKVMLYHWKQSGFFEGLLELYCSDHLDLLCFLDNLCSFLPSTHYVQLLKNERADQNSTLFMTREILSIKVGMTGLIWAKSEESLEEAKEGTDFQISCELWLRERSGIVLRPLVEAQLYRLVVERVIDTEIESDVAALVKAQLSVS